MRARRPAPARQPRQSIRSPADRSRRPRCEARRAADDVQISAPPSSNPPATRRPRVRQKTRPGSPSRRLASAIPPAIGSPWPRLPVATGDTVVPTRHGMSREPRAVGVEALKLVGIDPAARPERHVEGAGRVPLRQHETVIASHLTVMQMNQRIDCRQVAAKMADPGPRGACGEDATVRVLRAHQTLRDSHRN